MSNNDCVAETIIRIRTRVLELLENERENIDINELEEMVINSSDMIKRFTFGDEDFFLDPQGQWDVQHVNIERISRRIKRTLKWRQSFGLNLLHSSHFPQTFYQSKMFVYTIIDGKLMFYFRLAKFKKVSKEVSASFSAAAIHEVDRLVKRFAVEHENGVIDLQPVIVCVMTGVVITQVDWKNWYSTLSLINTHFPGVIKEYWLWGIPEYMSLVIRVFQSSLPPAIHAKTKIRSLEQAVELLGVHNIPRFLGGSSEIVPSYEIPDTFASLEEYASRFSINPSDMRKVRRYFDELLTGNENL